LDQQNNVISSIKSLGLGRVILIYILLILLTIFIFIPSNLLALNHINSYNNESSLISSIDIYKSEYFQNELDKYIGIPYIRGGTTEKGFDCSGFVRKIYIEFFGIDLPHKSSSQSSLPFMQKVTKDELITGDLVFFSTTGKNKRINHVGIYLSDGRFIHAAKGGVTISSLDNSYWKARFYVAKRVGNDDIWKNVGVTETPETALLNLYNNNSYRFNLLDDINNDSYAYHMYPFNYGDYPDDTIALGYEITWSASIADGSITPQITAFQKVNTLQWDTENISYHFRIEGLDFETVSNKSSYQGLRFTAALGNNDEGLSLTPSFTYYDTGHNLESRRLQRFSYGLDLEISPNNKSWLFALGMQYSDYTYSNNLTSFNQSNEYRSPMNISFTYLHKLNKSASLSFTSEIHQRYEPTPEGSLFDSLKNERRSMFLFNYNY